MVDCGGVGQSLIYAFEGLLVISKVIVEKGHEKVLAVIVADLFAQSKRKGRACTSIEKSIGKSLSAVVLAWINGALIDENRCMRHGTVVGSDKLAGVALLVNTYMNEWENPVDHTTPLHLTFIVGGCQR